MHPRGSKRVTLAPLGTPPGAMANPRWRRRQRQRRRRQRGRRWRWRWQRLHIAVLSDSRYCVFLLLFMIVLLSLIPTPLLLNDLQYLFVYLIFLILSLLPQFLYINFRIFPSSENNNHTKGCLHFLFLVANTRIYKSVSGVNARLYVCFCLSACLSVSGCLLACLPTCLSLSACLMQCLSPFLC